MTKTQIFFFLGAWFGVVGILALGRKPHLIVYFLLGLFMFTLTAGITSLALLRFTSMVSGAELIPFEQIPKHAWDEAILTAAGYVLLAIFVGFGGYGTYFYFLQPFLRRAGSWVTGIVSAAVLFGMVAATLLLFVRPVLQLTTEQALIFCGLGLLGVIALPFTRQSILQGQEPDSWKGEF